MSIGSSSIILVIISLYSILANLCVQEHATTKTGGAKMSLIIVMIIRIIVID